MTVRSKEIVQHVECMETATAYVSEQPRHRFLDQPTLRRHVSHTLHNLPQTHSYNWKS